MALIRINHTPGTGELRQFAGIWLPLFCALAAGFVYYGTGSAIAAAGILSAGVLAGGIGVAHPAFVRPVYLIWMYGAYPIGWVVSHLVMALVFYGVVTPIGAVMRLLGHDPMRRRLRRSETTYWVKWDEASSKRSYFRQY